MNTRQRRVVIDSRIPFKTRKDSQHMATHMSAPIRAEDNFDRPGTIAEAYALTVGDKPTISKVISLCREGILPATQNNDGIFVTPSVLRFVDTFERWCKTHEWSRAVGGTLDPGHVFLTSYLTRRVTKERGMEARLLVHGGKHRKSTSLSQAAKDSLLAGELIGAKKGARGWWSATPAEIDAWLATRWNITRRMSA